MKLKYIVSFILIFVIGFSLGYFVSIPKKIIIDIQLDDDFVNITEMQKSMVESNKCVFNDVDFNFWINSTQISMITLNRNKTGNVKLYIDSIEVFNG